MAGAKPAVIAERRLQNNLEFSAGESQFEFRDWAESAATRVASGRPESAL
jgi:hypothetical protein